jgi:hypothetical protein
MRPVNFFLFAYCLISLSQVNAQQPTIKILESGKRISIRGLSVVNDNVVWASGNNGSVARSTNGGNTFSWITVTGYEKRDFRDIEAFDSNTAVIMGVADPGIILKTNDGGKNWTKVYEDTSKGVFMDAMDFFNDQAGIVFGDPGADHKIYMVASFDRGDTWQKKDAPPNYGTLAEGEAFFASSGTNIRFRKEGGMMGVSGGKSARLFSWSRQPERIPIMQGLESTGANSIDIWDRKAVIVGGDFAKDTISTDNCVLVSFEKNEIKMSIPNTPPHGYRSCVIYRDNNELVTCGTSGVDISKDGGMNWELISKTGFHVCQKAKKGNAVFLAGGNGRIAKLVYP